MQSKLDKFKHRKNSVLEKACLSNLLLSYPLSSISGNYLPTEQEEWSRVQSGTKPLEKIHKRIHVFNWNVGKQRFKTFSHTPLPHTMLLLDGTFCSTLNGGGGGLEFYTNNQFARSNPVFNNCLNTFVQDCSSSLAYNPFCSPSYIAYPKCTWHHFVQCEQYTYYLLSKSHLNQISF